MNFWSIKVKHQWWSDECKRLNGSVFMTHRFDINLCIQFWNELAVSFYCESIRFGGLLQLAENPSAAFISSDSFEKLHRRSWWEKTIKTTMNPYFSTSSSSAFWLKCHSLFIRRKCHLFHHSISPNSYRSRISSFIPPLS